MEYRQLGKSGLKVPALSLGTGTFGTSGDFFKKWGDTDAKEASRMIDICIEHGLNLFDTANVYSQGGSEEVLGQAIKGRRDQVLILIRFCPARSSYKTIRRRGVRHSESGFRPCPAAQGSTFDVRVYD